MGKEDLISRQAAIDEIDEWIKAFRENGHKESAADACLIQDGIIQLPSVHLKNMCVNLDIQKITNHKSDFSDLDELPSVQEWIPVTEKLPEAEHGINKLVLATCEEPEDEDLFEEIIGWLEILFFDGRNWCYLGGERYEHKVTAWMPLPEPYKAHMEGAEDD